MTDAVAPITTSRRRVEHLDGLRALAALAVLVHHAWCMAYPPELGITAGTGAVGLATGWVFYGQFGVPVFIVLAGYSLTLRVANRDGALPQGFLGFMRARARRIIPPYWAAMVLAAFVGLVVSPHRTGTHWDLSVPFSAKGFGYDALLLQDVTYGRNVSYQFWSIAVEWHIYLIFPLLCLLWRRYGLAVALTIGLVGTGLAAAAVQVHGGRLAGLVLPYYFLFVLAFGACTVVARQPAWARRVPWRSAGLGFAVVTGVLCASHDNAWFFHYERLLDCLVGATTMCLLIAIGLGTAPTAQSILSWRPIAGMAAFSYSIYLVHPAVLQIVWKVTGQGHHSRGEALAWMWLVATPVCVAFAYGFYLLFEKRFATPARKPPLDAGRWTTSRLRHPTGSEARIARWRRRPAFRGRRCSRSPGCASA